MRNFNIKLKSFLHDPIDKAFNIITHGQRAKDYAQILGVSGLDDVRGSDWIASCMERSLLQGDIQQNLTEVRYPLAQTKIDLPQINPKEVEELIKNIYKELANDLVNRDDRFIFFYIWRNLLEKLQNGSLKKV